MACSKITHPPNPIWLLIYALIILNRFSTNTDVYYAPQQLAIVGWMDGGEDIQDEGNLIR